MTCDHVSLFNGISVILGQREGNKEKLCGAEPRVRLDGCPPSVGI